MAFKAFTVDDIEVTIYKRRGASSLRVSIRPDGKVRVTIPTWTTYSAGIAFVKSRMDWIIEQQIPVTNLLQGQAVGKAHHLTFMAKQGITKPTSRLHASSLFVYYPMTMTPGDAAVQAVALAACKKALKLQAEKLLPERLAELATKHGFTYTSVSVRELKSRWGSCDQSKHITFNFYLMQLPWDFIDYVIIHELVHTDHMNHGPEFWHRFGQCYPNYLHYKKELRKHKPVVIAGSLA
jgi:predicted metal-dependent hydrolase